MTVLLLIFQFGFILFLFSSLIAVASISKSMLEKSGESGYACLGPGLRGNAFSFSLLSMMLAVGLLHMAFIMLSYASSIPSLLRIFLSQIDAEFCQKLFLHLSR